MRYPTQKAYTYKEETITFLELCKSAQYLANTIKNCHTNRKMIGVLAERNINTPVYFFAALFAGSAYVPIDPDLPIMKIESIIQDAQISIVLCNTNYYDKMRSISDQLQLLSISDGIEDTCEIPQVDINSPCYMIYTSGSTGKPKGVLKSHSAVLSFINCFVETFDFSHEDIIGNQTPFFFDASAKDIYLSLKTGATVDIIPSELFPMPASLIEYLNERKITFVSWVPSALVIVAQFRTFSFIKPTTLKKVFFVGEAMPMKQLNYWRVNLPEIQYVNLYGQSELAGICCYYEVKDFFDNSDVLPLGKTLRNCRIYLMDGDSIVTDPDHIGEMYLVSDALALEYYHDVEKTNISFPYKDFGSGIVRCFKTGDFARLDKTGNLIFTARNDFQIKHMGHRIELGEIETIAGSLDIVDRCACFYKKETAQIILFVQVSSNIVTSSQEIKRYLKPVITSYMLPHKIIILDEIPLNANGKINRTLLKELL